MYRIVIGALAAVLAIGVIAISRTLAARQATTDDQGPFSRLRQRAEAAKTGDRVAVRLLTDAVFDLTLQRSAGRSLRDRIFRAEMAFRNRTYGGISERQFAQLVNDQVDQLGGPEYLRTSAGQVHSFRVRWRKVIPQIGLPEQAPGDLPDSMAPAEMSLIALQLAMLKLEHPDYRLPADESERRNQIAEANATAARERGENIAASLRGGTRNAREPDMRRALVNALRDDSSAETRAAHHVLDLLQLPK